MTVGIKPWISGEVITHMKSRCENINTVKHCKRRGLGSTEEDKELRVGFLWGNLQEQRASKAPLVWTCGFFQKGGCWCCTFLFPCSFLKTAEGKALLINWKQQQCKSWGSQLRPSFLAQTRALRLNPALNSSPPRQHAPPLNINRTADMIAAGISLFRCFPCCPWFCLLCWIRGKVWFKQQRNIQNIRGWKKTT